MKTLHQISLAFLMLILVSSCDKVEEPAFQTKAEAEGILNVAYGADPKQQMDVYLPPNRTSNTGVIIFVHGGSFFGGDKNLFTPHALVLAQFGYAVVNVNYRLVDGDGLFDIPFPQRKNSPVKVKDQVTDLSAVVDYVRNHTKEWVISNKRIAIAGHSAGGTLALLYANDDRNTGKVQAVANLAGPLDMIFTNVPNWQSLLPYIFEAGRRYTGYPIEVANEQHYKDISPIFKLSNQHKTATFNAFPEYNMVAGLPKQDVATYHAFTGKLNELQVPNRFLFVAGADHNFSKKGSWELVINEMVEFFNQNLK